VVARSAVLRGVSAVVRSRRVAPCVGAVIAHPLGPRLVARKTNPDNQFAGVMLWYSIIHTPPAGQARIFAEATRVLRPSGHLLVGFQSGDGTRDVSGAYRQFGHQIQLECHLYTADQVASQIEAAGLQEVCRLVRRAQGKEKDDQAVLLAKAD
jgi:hypothetical protein